MPMKKRILAAVAFVFMLVIMMAVYWKIGFSDYKYFSMVFKKYTDSSPSDFVK